jgi:hypothetical protein
MKEIDDRHHEVLDKIMMKESEARRSTNYNDELALCTFWQESPWTLFFEPLKGLKSE